MEGFKGRFIRELPPGFVLGFLKTSSHRCLGLGFGLKRAEVQIRKSE